MKLSKQQLVLLRELLSDEKSRAGGAISGAIRLAGTLESKAVTIDFESAAVLGHPMVVLRERSPAMHALSPRESEVAALLARGLSNKEIAADLCVSVATVKDHVHSILTKTGLDSRTKVAVAYRASR